MSLHEQTNKSTLEVELTSVPEGIIQFLQKRSGTTSPGIKSRYWVRDIVACQRKNYYKAIGIEQEQLLNDTTLESMWEKVRGDLLHYITHAYRWREMDIEYRVLLKNRTEAVLVGRLDMFDWKEKAIIDLKTTKFIKWQIRHGFLPRPEDILQVQCYSIIFSQVLEVENLKIVYADMSDIVTYKIQKRDLTEWIRRRIQNIEDSVLCNNAPTGEVSGLCKYCKYQTRCYNDGNGLVDRPHSRPSVSPSLQIQTKF